MVFITTNGLKASLVLSTIALSASALPATSSGKSLNPRQFGGFVDTNSICAIQDLDPFHDWENSGASVFLEKFIKQHGEKNWDNAIDQTTTEHGSQGTSQIDCRHLVGGNCPQPSTPCKFFTPPALFFVRTAMARCYSLFNALRTRLVDNTITTALQVDTLVADFKDDDPIDNSKIFTNIGAAFGIAAGVTAADAAISGPLGVFGAVFGGLAGNPPDKNNDPTAGLNKQLSDAFSQSEKQLESAVNTIFGGGGNTSALPNLSSPNGETTNIAKFFAGGKFLSTAAGDDVVKTIVDKGAILLKQSLVISLLKAQGFYVFVDTSRTLSDCNKITGSRFINNQCFTIESFNADNRPRPDGNTIIPRTQLLDATRAGKLDNSNYQIDLPTFYQNADACQSAHPDFSGSPSSNNLPTDGSLPQCFFNLPVIKAKVSPCEALKAGIQLPSSLGFDSKSCGAGLTAPVQHPDPHHID